MITTAKILAIIGILLGFTAITLNIFLKFNPLGFTCGLLAIIIGAYSIYRITEL